MKKIIMFIFSALIAFAAPCGACFAEESNGPSPSSLSPNLIVESYSVSEKEIHNGSSFTLSFKLKNTNSDIKIENILIHLSGGDVFSIDEATDTVYTGSISAGSTKTFSKAFYCSNSAENGRYPISISAAYEYYDGGEKFSGTAESSMSIRVTKKAEQSAGDKAFLTPQLLITDFSYGSDAIQGGNVFPLKFTVKNNSDDLTVQNIIIKLSGGESFVVADGTDTLSMKSLSKNASVSLSKNFKCLNSVSTGVYPITANISYEYYDGEKASGSAELTMSIPVVQPDRVQIEALGLADQTLTLDTESDCSFQIVNSGQTRLSSGAVKLLDESGAELASAFIGNIDPGTQFASNYTLPVTFSQTGVKKLTLVFEYENENMEKKSIEQQFNVTVEEYVDPYEDVYDEETDANEPAANYIPVIIYCAVGAVVIIAAAIIIKKTVKKRKARKGSESFDEEI